eukprot:CAMPEP_0178996336 /NCGR_PEP_ID=MMETSP0795-20121207/8316_1 /TAXON_ID=88552 /ORGANISM="Amoebophrya sp., Strain Ameob2" /LENGTH=358 /DNA_ID=CAMNT_0020688723 /DNA_START=188 /DNA_END=1264 /DNA_ORIENTATION=+
MTPFGEHQNSPAKVFPGGDGPQFAYGGAGGGSASSSSSGNMVVGAPMIATQPVIMTPMTSSGAGHGQPVFLMAPSQSFGGPLSPIGGGGMLQMQMQQPLAWDRPRVCGECTQECWMACACACLSIDVVSNEIALPAARQHTWMVGLCVGVRWCADMARTLEEMIANSNRIFGIMVLVSLLVSALGAIFLMRWKNYVGQHLKVRPDEVFEDFICMWCCPCHHIPAVHRTANLVQSCRRGAGGAGAGAMMGAGGAPAAPMTMMMAPSSGSAPGSANNTGTGPDSLMLANGTNRGYDREPGAAPESSTTTVLAMAPSSGAALAPATTIANPTSDQLVAAGGPGPRDHGSSIVRGYAVPDGK